MDQKIFRQQSIKRIQSPDNLKEYIKVINPSLWIVFIAAFLLLAGAFVWGSVGKIEDKAEVTVVCQNGNAVCEYDSRFEEGMKVSINGLDGTIKSVTSNGVSISFEKAIPDGIYQANVVVGEISPISFVFN